MLNTNYPQLKSTARESMESMHISQKEQDFIQCMSKRYCGYITHDQMIDELTFSFKLIKSILQNALHNDSCEKLLESIHNKDEKLTNDMTDFVQKSQHHIPDKISTVDKAIGELTNAAEDIVKKKTEYISSGMTISEEDFIINTIESIFAIELAPFTK